MATLTNLISNATGNVGIGTASPASKLSIAGSSATNFKSLILRNGDGTVGSTVSIDLETSAGTIGDEAAMAARISGIRLGSGTTGGLVFSTTDNGILGERVRILNNGNVGIGTTSPSSKLHIDDAITPYITITRAGVPTWQLRNNFPSNQYGFSFNNTTAGTVPLFIGTGGNIGIGLDNPTVKLDIASTQGNGIVMRYDTSTAYQSWIRPYWNSGTDTRIDFAINRTANVTPDVIMSVGYGGRVGIGTTSPSAKLDVSGSAIRSFITAGSTEPGFIVDYPSSNGYGAFFVHVNNTRRWRIGSVGDTNVQPALNFWQEGTGSRMIINNVGRVGMGTSSPSGNLDVVSSDSTTTYIRGASSALRFLAYADGTNWIQSGTSTSNSSADLIFSSMNGSSQWMRIQGSSGNVGIGTSSPGTLLHLQSSAATTTLRIDNTNSDNDAAILLTDSNNPTGEGLKITYDSSVGDTYFNNIYTSSTRAFNFQKGNFGSGTDLLTILNNGNVGIGTTSPNELLEVTGTSPIIRVLAISGNSTLRLTDNGVRNWDLKVVDVSDYFEVGGTSATSLVVTGAGNVGIGTTSPADKLDVNGAVYIRGGNSLKLDNASNNYVAQISNGGSSGTSYLSFTTGGSERMRIINGGNVGIGQSAPAANLHVNGSTMIVGDTSTTQNVRQTIVGSTTGNASTTAKKIFVCGHTSTGTINVTAIITSVSTASATATFSFANAFGNNVTPNRLSYISLNSTITSIDCSYNNSGYQMEISVTYTGATAPTLYFTAEGMGSGIWTL